MSSYNGDPIVQKPDSETQLRKRFVSVIGEIVPDIESHLYPLPFSKIGIDSVDLITIRAEIENINQESVPDKKWIAFTTLNEIVDYCVDRNVIRNGEIKFAFDDNSRSTGHISINMPQMAIEALSESWLFKELGNRHWDMLCNGLNTPSSEIRDAEGNRLYATFVRIRIVGTRSLAAIKENAKLEVSDAIQRYGAAMYLSRITLCNDSCSLICELMTSFSLRNSSDNTRLVKSQPETANNLIPGLLESPVFADEYRSVKKKLQDHIFLNGERFEIADTFIFQTDYAIHPYYDLNGVGLLYFAAYPIIIDICEARFFKANYPGIGRWETQWFTLSRDIFYYGNCNSDDTVIFHLHSVEVTESDVAKTSSSLFRKHDGMLIARVFTLKQKKP